MAKGPFTLRKINVGSAVRGSDNDTLRSDSNPPTEFAGSSVIVPSEVIRPPIEVVSY